VRIDRINSPIGSIVLVATDSGLCAIDMFGSAKRLAKQLCVRQPPPTVADPGLGGWSAAVSAYFAGELTALDALPVSFVGGTDFQRQVWSALRTIPLGQTTSYAALAARIGRPKAVRAVGAANGANPVPLVVPCHRVIGQDQSLTGFGGGLARKAWLLRHEGAGFKDPGDALGLLGSVPSPVLVQQP
jgi:methylated-DNA-[protein]-cysteine S-methyltransferase